MASRAELIITRLVEVAQAALVGVQVYRSREQPSNLTSYVCIDRGAEAFEHFGNATGNTRARLEMMVTLYATGTPWDQQADAMAVTLNAAIKSDAVLTSLADQCRLVAIEPTPAASPVDAGEFLLRYEWQYITRAAGLDSKPVNLI